MIMEIQELHPELASVISVDGGQLDGLATTEQSTVALVEGAKGTLLDDIDACPRATIAGGNP
jgi:hypothetical protein